MEPISNILFQLKFGFFNHYLIGSGYSTFYYELFYLLAFLVATIWLLLEGHRRKINWVSWLIILAFSRLFFIIGTKVAAYSLNDWGHLVYHLDFVPTSSKIVLGGLFLGLLAFGFGIKIFKLPVATFDTLAFAVPISIAIQRVGCFILGCCFGTPTGMPWGVRYSFGTIPHFKHARAGLIEIPSVGSLPVHPFPLYEALNCLVVVLILYYLIKKKKFKGSLLALSMGIWSGNRFLLEFFRDPMAHAGYAGEIIAGLKLMQWLLLITMILSFSIHIISKKRPFITNNFSIKPNSYAVLFLLMVSVLLTWHLRDWLQPIELLALNIILLPTIGFTAVYLFQENSYPAYRWMTLSFMVMPIFLMSQTWVIQDKNKGNKTSYHSVRTGYGSGTFYTNSDYYGKVTIYPEPCEDCGCDGGPIEPEPYDEFYTLYENFKHSYWASAVGYSKTKVLDNGEITFGTDLIFGSYKETKLGENPITTTRSNYAVRPYALYDAKWFGVGAGLLLGDLSWVKKNQGDISTSVARHSKSASVLPSVYARLGPEQYFFVDYGYANTFPSPAPGMIWEFGVGSGFGLPKGNTLRVGGSEFGGFFQANVKFNSSFQLSSSYIWSETSLMYNAKDNYYLINTQWENNRQFLLGLKYNFGEK
jgi:prolipoprotein diacylglyceryltransferase